MADLTATAWNEIPRNARPDDLVAPNFTLGELTKSELALRRGIDNGFPGVRELRNAVYLARAVLQPIRNKFGRYSPNSVFRSQELERALKGKPARWTSDSQHTLGLACDVEVPNATTRELAEWVLARLDFDQLILEMYDPRQGANSGWVHVSVLPPGEGDNRHEVLSYIRDRRSGKFVYRPGLTATA